MGSWISGTDDLALRGTCEASPHCRAAYSWTLIERYPNGTELTLTAEETAQATEGPSCLHKGKPDYLLKVFH
ncbi:unnamed protein product [Dibothriocephalus latus]|uniref:Uncharacterized protein n=1 Tax=Dibothriocephalus latus TaxID=60516 RepID=A0A3P7PI59_DIBLA|nr:unnamed protein product [Dibothriocephalus latus]